MKYFPLRSMITLALVAGSAIAFAFSYAISAPFIGLAFTEFVASNAPQLFSLIFMITAVGVALFFEPKIKSFISAVFASRPERYVNTAV